jgi:phage terminase large subunit GpA-like protein
MRPDSIQAALSTVQIPDERNVWQWAADEVDYSRHATYETELKSKYNPDYLPYFKEVQEAITDRDVSEVWILKNSRAGATENCLLNPIRWAVARGGYHMLFVSGNEDGAIDFFEKRIKDGLKLAQPSKRKLSASIRNDKTRVYFPDGNITATWPRNRMAFKASGYNLILADEVSIWTEYSTDMLRKRGDNWAFSKIIGVSSPDPAQKRGSDEDPIFIEYRGGDQRRWMCKDANGDEFSFEMGGKDTAHGLKWAADAKMEDGQWDYDKVKSSAYYVTPSGCIISEPQRMEIVRSGTWQPTATNKNKVRSYHINAFMSPFKSGEFGNIAVAFLKANQRGPMALKTFFYEYLAQAWYGEKQTIEINTVEQRRGNYQHGQRLITSPAYKFLSEKRSIVTMSIDVQKSRFFAVVREWFDGGDSALVEFAEIEMWKDLAALAAKHNVNRMCIDMGYTERRVESLEQIFYGYIKGAIPMFGRDNLKEAFDVRKDYDPFEGTGKQGRHKLPMITFNPNLAKYQLAKLMDGTDAHQWLLPSNIPPEYIKQVTAEECIDGQWIKKNNDNHALDCETMGLTMAQVIGVYRIAGIDLDESKSVPSAINTVTRTRKTGVYMPD